MEHEPANATTAAPSDEQPVIEQVIEAELLVEEISIDGMCGVY